MTGLLFTRRHCGLGMIAAAIAVSLGAVPALAGNIVTFGANANKCGGAVICSYDGTTGYINNGKGQPFNLSTIRQWFQIDAGGTNFLSGQSMPEPDKGAGSFLVTNDTGSAVTSFSLRLNDDFTSKTASVHACTGVQKGNICDNFTAHGGSGNFTYDTELNGADWDRCTQGAATGQTCTGKAGGVAADFAPGSATYTWTAEPGKSIPAGGTFTISFSGWNNDGWAAPRNAYITNSADATVSVIDTGTNNVIATIGVGAGPWGVGVSPDGRRVYVANASDNSVSVIDTASETVTATVPVGKFPQGAVVSPDGSKVYVTNALSSTLSVIDAANETVTATISDPGGVYPQGVAVSPDGGTVFVANAFGNSVAVIDTATNQVSGTITVGSTPIAVAISPDGTKLYVTNAGFGSSSVSVIDTANETVTATIPVGLNPSGVAVSPDGSTVYVTNATSGTVSVIDVTTLQVSATVTTATPFGVSVTPDGSRVYVANDLGKGAGTVSVIDAGTDTVTATIPVGNRPVAFGNFIQP